ncbi:PFL family protein [Lentilactobacillus buchneri]|nr:PFL family protein [Lentilactobacillus sp. Egmn17]
METKQILETILMISEEKLDIRTITMGISLFDCIDSDGVKARQKIYDKLTTSAKDLVKVADRIESEYGIPIVNKRISVTPISMIAAACHDDNYVAYAQTMEKAAETLGVDLIGGFSALVQKGYQSGDRKLIASMPEALSETQRVCGSVNVGSTRAGINMDAVKQMGQVVKDLSEIDPVSCMSLVVFANAVEDNPFMAGAFHGVGEADKVINVGISGPGVVKRALEQVKGESIDTVSETIKKTAFKVTRMGQFVGNVAAKALNVPFGIVDLSLAPTPSQGGAFIPVSEDSGMIKAVEHGNLNLEKLEAMTAVCSVGLDMVAVPGDTPAETISGMIADEAAIGVINNKTTAVRVIPAKGKQVGEQIDFGGIFGYAPVMPVNTNSPAKFVQRGGRIPAPIHSFKN